MFSSFLKPKFYSKCKAAIKLTETRLETISKKRNVVEMYLKKDIVDLLKNGFDNNAYGRAEGLLVEQNMLCCYDFIKQFCESISSNLSVMQKERECPEECREAVASLMFAAARFADLPELRELRSLFTEKYGTSLENFVNKEFHGRLEARPPTKDVKIQLMREIADEFSLQWNSKALEQKLFTPPPTIRENPKYASPEENRDDSHWWGGRERPRFVPERETEDVGSKLPHEEPKRIERPWPLHHPKEGNDISVKPISGREDVDEQQQENTNHSRKQSYRNIPPPYIIEKPGKEKHAAEGNKAHEDELAHEAKPKPRSVRQSRLKHSAGHEIEQSSRATKTSDSQNEVDEEESDRVNGSLKLPHLREDLSRDSNNSSNQKDGKSEFGVPPTRAASLPADATSPTESNETAKGHYRANSLQNQMFLRHVHPNLPDYDDLASRIAALRER